MVSELAAKDDLCRRHACGWVWSVPVDQESSSKLVTIQGAIWLKIISHHPFASFHGDLRSQIGVGIVGGGDPLSDTPASAEGSCLC